VVCVDRTAANVVGGPERDLTAGVPSGAVASYQTLAPKKSHVEEYTSVYSLVRWILYSCVCNFFTDFFAKKNTEIDRFWR